MLEHLGWTELLRRWSGEAIAHAGSIGLEITPGVRASGWIGYPPAPAADIATARARLGPSLPRSYQAFLAVTDGWPTLSFAFGRVRPVAELDWVAAADPELYEVACADYGYEWPPDSDDGPPLMNRTLLLSSGTDYFLYDTGRPGADGEWATTCWTGWYPGPGTSSLRSAPAWSRTTRASSASTRPTAAMLADSQQAADPAMLTDLWPMLVIAAASPDDPQPWALDQAIDNAGEPVAGLLRALAGQRERAGGLAADFGYAPAFAAAAEHARGLARAGRDAEAFEAILAPSRPGVRCRRCTWPRWSSPGIVTSAGS